MTRVVDLSGGDSHIREIAEESGIDWEQCWSNEEVVTIGNVQIEIHYNESASSPWNAWNAFIHGTGTYSAECREYAIERAWKRHRKLH